jgi:inner membrane protein involved in colicin E2 resistance
LGKHIFAVVIIYFGAVTAWMILGNTVQLRTHTQDSILRQQVGQLWGAPQRQKAPEVSYEVAREIKTERTEGGKTVVETRTEKSTHFLPVAQSNIDVDQRIDYRQKGLLWYSTYRVGFAGNYEVVNSTGEERELFFNFNFPNSGAIYDNFRLLVNGEEVKDLEIRSGVVGRSVRLKPGQAADFLVAYESQGMDEWWYDFGDDVNQIKNFTLNMNTDFKDIDFPQNSISPTIKKETDKGWQLTWQYSNLLTGVKIGLLMPKKLNPGPWVASVSYFAPISLFFFLFVMFIITAMRSIRIHPMNYLFLCAAFFSFHLLLAYLVDHISIHLAFLICSLVSVFLVVSYMRLVVGERFAFFETGLTQFVYLVVFSYTFFFKGYTGLAVTVLSIVTLFILMQMTGRVNWSEIFAQGGKKLQQGTGPK